MVKRRQGEQQTVTQVKL